MGAALEIRTDLASPARLRQPARGGRSPRTASRMQAITSTLEGMSRAEAARLPGMERLALRDALNRHNAEGPGGLRDRAKPGRASRLSEAEQAVLLDALFRGPNRTEDGGSDWMLRMPCRWIERCFDKLLHLASLSRILRRLDPSRQKTHPLHPRADEKAKAAFARRGSAMR